MSAHVHVVGVGMLPFTKPGASAPYHEMGRDAARLALANGGLAYEQVQQAYVGYVYGDSTCGQAAVYGLGLTGIPVFNVNNNCATGSSALFLARQAVASGAVVARARQAAPARSRCLFMVNSFVRGSRY